MKKKDLQSIAYINPFLKLKFAILILWTIVQNYFNMSMQ